MQDDRPPTGTHTVIGVTADDDRFNTTRRAAMSLAKDEGAELILYDWDAASKFGNPLPSVWSAEGTDEDVPDRLHEQELEAAGRDAIARQVSEARAEGLDASAWLPSEHGPKALVQYARDHNAVGVVVPDELRDVADGSAKEAEDVGAPLRVVVA
ncbi:MAG: hypothetical protein ACJ77O_07615 [Chloroflexota bacterium]